MAQTVDERVHDENSAREFVRTWRADIATLADVKYFQFGSVSTHGQWRVEPGEDGWQVAADVNQDFAAWLLTQELESDQIYWSPVHSSREEIGLFWVHINDQGDKVYFLAVVNFAYRISGDTTAPRLGAVMFLSDKSRQRQVFPLVSPADLPVASTPARLWQRRENWNFNNWDFLLTDEYQQEKNLDTPLILEAQGDNQKFWVKLIPVVTYTDYQVMAVVVAQHDALWNLGVSWEGVYWLIVAVIAITLGTFLFYYWQFSRRYYFTNQVRDIINAGENTRVEFKSSLRFDLKTRAYNKNLENTVLKSVAAFNNTDGGILMIGLSDEGEVLGLQPDYQTLKKPDKDGFELHLRSLISQSYGEHFAARRVEIFFPVLENQEICVCKIKKGRSPLYTVTMDKDGAKTERFYIRMGNSSREIEKPSDIVDYQNQRFKWRFKMGRR